MGGESPTKKMVERVKEIMHDFSDEEIRSMLEECNMNPDEAVQRLLLQGFNDLRTNNQVEILNRVDTFHEVKSKRERRKEVKEMQELKFQGGSNISNWEADSDLDAGNFSNAYKNQTGYVTSSLSGPSYAYPPTAEAISENSGHMSAPVNAESTETSTADNVIVSPRLAEARSYLQDVMRRSKGYDSGDSKTDSSQGSSEQISPPSQTKRHQSSRDSDATVRAMSTPTDNDDGGVLLPSHIQALAAECSNLTFGTYNTNLSSTNFGQSKSDPSTEADVSSMQQLCLPEHLLNDILEPDNNFSEGNQKELFKNQQDMQRNLNSGSNTESTLLYFRQRDMLNSTYPPDEARYNKAVSSMNSQAISIPEQILGADYDKAVKLPHVLFDTATQHKQTLDGVGNSGGFPNINPQNYGHKPPVEDVLQYRAAANDGHGLPHFNKRQEHPLTSLAHSSTDASGFGSSTHSRGSFLRDASVAVSSAPPGFVPNVSVAANNAPPGFLPNASVATNAPPGFETQFNAPPGFETQFNDRNSFSGPIGSNIAMDYGVRSGAMPNAPGQRAYGRALDYGVRSGGMPNAQDQRVYGSLLHYGVRSGAMPNAQEQRAHGSLFNYGVGSGSMPNAQGHRAYDSSVEAQQRYRRNNYR